MSISNISTTEKIGEISNDIPCVKSARIWGYSVRIRENADQNNSEYGHFSRSDMKIIHIPLI